MDTNINLDNKDIIKMKHDIEYIIGPIELNHDDFKKLCIDVSEQELQDIKKKYTTLENFALSRKKLYLFETIINAIPKTKELSQLQYDTLNNFHKILLNKK